MLFLARLNKEEKMEACYNLFDGVNWDLTLFNNNTDLFIEDVRKNAKEYIENVLKKPLTKEQVWCLSPRSIRILINTNSAILKEMLNEGKIHKNQFLDVEWLNNDLRNNIWKFCYDTCEELRWINEHIDEYCVKHNISSSSFNYLARQYMSEVLKMDEIQQDEHWNKRLSYRKDHILNEKSENNGVFANLYTRLLETEDKDEVIKIFTELNRKYFLIKHCLTDFLISYNIPSDKRENVLNKLDIYYNYLKENRKLEQDAKKTERENQYIEDNFDNARTTIHEYVNSEYDDVNKYCLDKNIERKVFDKYLELVKNNEESLYMEYLEHIENNKNKVYEDLLSKALAVIDLIKNGVFENGVQREADLVDYYKYLPLGFDKMLKIVRDGINPEDYKLLCSFVGKYKNERELSEFEINNIYNMKTIVNVKFDEENKVIPGSGREITIEEKQNIINATLKNTYESIMSLDIASYFMYMEKILSNRAEKKSGELIMSKRDKDNVTESFIKAAKEKGLSISPNTRDINGGFVLVYGDIEENFSIEDMMREKNDELCDVISNILF